MFQARSTFRALTTLFAFCLASAAVTTGCATLPIALEDTNDHLVPIEVALEPDAALDNRANTGKSHIALVRHFVRGRDLHHVSAVIANVMATARLESLSLRATGYRTGTWNGITGTAMTIEPSPDLRRLEERIVENLRMFAEDPETAEDYIVTTDGVKMRGHVIDAVARFVPDSSGANYRPHAMVSSMQADEAKRLETQAFAPFTFKATTVTVYQLDQAGVARRALWTWTGEPGARQP